MSRAAGAGLGGGGGVTQLGVAGLGANGGRATGGPRSNEEIGAAAAAACESAEPVR